MTWNLAYALSLVLSRLTHSADSTAQVINGIQTGPFKNIYNPENFYVGKNGVGAANNWGDGYQTGESVCEDIMEMIDREADGSDSLEVGKPCTTMCARSRR